MNKREQNERVQSRAMASLIDSIDREQLLALKNEFPGDSELFDLTYKLGAEEGQGVPRETYTLALRALAEKTVELSAPAIEKLERKLWARSILARRARLGGSVVALVTSASIVATITSSHPKIGTFVSLITLIGSILMLYGENLEKAIVGSNKSLSELIGDTAHVDCDLKDLQLRMLSEDLGERLILIDIAKQANNIAARIKQISVYGNVTIAIKSNLWREHILD
ncbi:hypothetical protein [Burkholderia ubonensis]|uniref:hypothetical protein n=1 Tax=Burkholderia ubonensis TaxID=101571 RepID=UPI000A9008A3|nr:hypothetical protein [Burkholderia ubonensis]